MKLPTAVCALLLCWPLIQGGWLGLDPVVAVLQTTNWWGLAALWLGVLLLGSVGTATFGGS